MPEYKFTSNGKKVVVIGALNSKEFIVQEVFVNDGTEFPAGEHFTVKTLLDVPAETYQSIEEKRLEKHIIELKKERDKLSKEISNFRQSQNAASAKINWIKSIKDQEVERIFDHIRSFVCGEYTHIVFNHHGDITIQEWGAEIFARYENDYGDRRFDGIRLVSLFGNWQGRLEMDWRLNQYQDGSGSGWQTFYPCKSYELAIDKVKEILDSKDHLSDKDYDICIKYSIPVNEEKNAKRVAKKRESIQSQINKEEKQLLKLRDDLEKIS